VTQNLAYNKCISTAVGSQSEHHGFVMCSEFNVNNHWHGNWI